MQTSFKNLRMKRLESDYKEMLKLLSCPKIKWTAIRGKPPHVEEYLVTLNFHTYRTDKTTMDSCKIRITLSDIYPKVAPIAVMIEPKIFNPNWFSSGRWCCGKYYSKESLGDFVIRMIRSIQFDPIITNPNSPANKEAAKWYIENIDRGIFPTDNSILPIPKVSSFNVVKK